jgi:hypothetical protein
MNDDRFAARTVSRKTSSAGRFAALVSLAVVGEHLPTGGASGSGGRGGSSANAGSGGASGGAAGARGGSSGADAGQAGSSAGKGAGGSAGEGAGGESGAAGGTGGAGGSEEGGDGNTSGAGGKSGGSGGSAGKAGAGGKGGTAGGGGGSAGSRTTCQMDADCNGFKCCDDVCVNPLNDITNCGGCGTTCQGPNPYCANGTCGTPPCDGSCNDGTTCCGSACCGAGQLCCTVTLGPEVTDCFEPVEGTCPTGCSDCVCSAPDTPVATPEGERPIAELETGDLVYSIHRGQVVAVPIRETRRQKVTPQHAMVRVLLEGGRELRLSHGHPTADGRTFGQLASGDLLDGVTVREASLVQYSEPYTYDLLPESDSATYFAASVLIGSTLGAPWSGLPISAGPIPAVCAPPQD